MRFSTEPFSTSKESLQNQFIHLTNYAINKDSDQYVSSDEAKGDGVGSKWSFKALRRKFVQMNLDYEAMLKDLDALVVKTLLLVQPHILRDIKKEKLKNVKSFEIYGFDILLDDDI